MSSERANDLPDAALGGGTWVLVVGPSGAGKDTVIDLARQALASDERVQFARRIVTREPNRFEDHDSVTPAEFARLETDGKLVMSWTAHGLSYGIHECWHDAVTDGAIVVCNVSRTIIAEAMRRLPKIRVVLVTAPPDVLAQRIASRGRDIDKTGRLQRRVDIDFDRFADLVVNNTSAPAQGAAPLIALLQELAAPSAASSVVN